MASDISHYPMEIQDDYPKSVQISTLFLPVYPKKQQNLHLGNAVWGLVLLTFDWHRFSLDLSPGGAWPSPSRDHLWPNDAAPTWMDQILPKSRLKGRKISQKCTSNALKIPHFSAAAPWALRLKFPFPAPLEQPGRALTPSSCLSCCFHGNGGHTAKFRCFNHYFLLFSSHFPAWQRGTIPLDLTFLRQVLSSLQTHISLYFGRN